MKLLSWFFTDENSNKDIKVKLCLGLINEDVWGNPRDTLYPQKLALASLTSGGCSVGIVRLWTTSHGVFFNMGEWSYRSNLLNLSTRSKCPSRFTPKETASGAYCKGGWMGPRAGPGIVQERKFLSPTGNQTRAGIA
jgi:hypothetical protein